MNSIVHSPLPLGILPVKFPEPQTSSPTQYDARPVALPGHELAPPALPNDDPRSHHRADSGSSEKTAVDPPQIIKAPQIIKVNPTSANKNRRYEPPSSPIKLSHKSIATSSLLKYSSNKHASMGGWIRYVHPEGKAYFYDPTKQVPTVTEDNLLDRTVLDRIEAAYQAVSREMETSDISFGSLRDAELFLELDPYDDEACNYFFVHHDSCCLFWLDDNVTTYDLDLHSVWSDEHLRLQLLREYWSHVEHFPNHVTLPAGAENQLMEILVWSSLDHMTCETSTAAYPVNKIAGFISVLQSCPKGLKTWSVARLSALLVGHQFFNFYGLETARLERTTSVEEHYKHPPSLWMKFFFLFLFNAPNTHLEKLDKLWVDQVLYAEQWELFITDLLRDWNDISLLATVLLAGNMAFLAISSIPSAANVASIASTLFAMGSIIISLVNGRQQRSRLAALSTQARAFLERVYSPRLGLQLLAIFFALPYTLMLWSVMTFAAAIIISGFQDFGDAPTIVILVVAVLVGIVILITVGFVWLDDRQWEIGTVIGWSTWIKNRLAGREAYHTDIEAQT